ncbi:hypothetical protein EVAR_23132_1 [Eumeta japonica]|uniref:Uncharacterized protein n=1 Tax=Eumeta variegata TaxID=151549 RepID=A0A4C1VB97_EUMVA|nr:hypothetical protein EVAR_23132_1 [Eumeta japonica]
MKDRESEIESKGEKEIARKMMKGGKRRRNYIGNKVKIGIDAQLSFGTERERLARERAVRFPRAAACLERPCPAPRAAPPPPPTPAVPSNYIIVHLPAKHIFC